MPNSCLPDAASLHTCVWVASMCQASGVAVVVKGMSSELYSTQSRSSFSVACGTAAHCSHARPPAQPKSCRPPFFTRRRRPQENDNAYLNNHLSFTILYHKDAETDLARIVGFEVEPYSIHHKYEGESVSELVERVTKQHKDEGE